MSASSDVDEVGRVVCCYLNVRDVSLQLPPERRTTSGLVDQCVRCIITRDSSHTHASTCQLSHRGRHRKKYWGGQIMVLRHYNGGLGALPKLLGSWPSGPPLSRPHELSRWLLLIKPPAANRRLYAMMLSFCLLMLIMLIVCPFVRHQRVLVGQWPEWCSTAIVLAAVSGRSAVGPPGQLVTKTFLAREKLHPGQIYASGGGLIVAPPQTRYTVFSHEPPDSAHSSHEPCTPCPSLAAEPP